MEQKKFLEILKRYRLGDVTLEERKVIDEWYEAMDSQEGKVSIEDEEKIKNRYWIAIARQTNINRSFNRTSDSGGQGKSRFLRLSIGIAATLIGICIVFYYWSHDDIIRDGIEIAKVLPKEHEHTSGSQEINPQGLELINTKNEPQQFTLPDSSVVTLKPQSHLRVSVNFNKTLREVYLEGEGFFIVTRNEKIPFVVYTRQVSTKVLGTSFIVKALQQDSKVTVTVKTGRVSVVVPTNRKTPKTEVILTPNQELTYDKDEDIISRQIVDEPQPLISQAEIKRIRFEDSPVSEIFSTIEKIYGVEIVFDEKIFSSCKLTTSITDGNLFNRLDIISSAIGATYSRQEDKIVFSGKGCN
jgi:hypothetical protein